MDYADVRTKTEELVEETLKRLYPKLEFQTNVRVAGLIPDFMFPKYNAVLEVDGAIHDSFQQREKSERRDRQLRQHGLMVFHLRNADIHRYPDGAAHVIAITLGIKPRTRDRHVFDNFFNRIHKQGLRPQRGRR